MPTPTLRPTAATAAATTTPTSPPSLAQDSEKETMRGGGGGPLSLKKVAMAGLGAVLITGLLVATGTVRFKKK